MTIEHLIQELQTRVCKMLVLRPDAISAQSDLGICGLDSIKTVLLVVELEENYNINFAEQDLFFEHFNTIEKLAKLVFSKLMLM